MTLNTRLLAEFIGTFWLVLGGCGSAVLAAAFPEVGIGLLGVSLAFGLTVLTMAFAIGHVSGCHLNPAVTRGLATSGRFKAAEVIPYWIAQVLGAITAAALLYLIASGKAGFELAGGLASNGYGEHSPGKYPLYAGFLTELVMTFMFWCHHGRDRRPGAQGLRADRHRPRADADPPDQHPGDQYLRESGAQHRPRPDRRRLGAAAAVAVLGRAARRRRARRPGIPLWQVKGVNPA
jgi:hypothetical protein